MKKILKQSLIILLSFILFLYTLELLATIFLPSKINVHLNLDQLRYKKASQLGIDFDTRSSTQAFLEEKEKNTDLVPKYLFLHYLEKTVLFEDIQKHSLKSFFDSKVNSKSPIPFRGPVNKKTLTCNENGKRKIVNNDKNGFKNPNSIYKKKIKIFLLGDSFAEGMCHDENNDAAGFLRNTYKINSANFGVAGAGPLTSLAVLKEYVRSYKPDLVFYFYYDRNDMQDLKSEKKSFLIKYLQDFNQNLINRNDEVNKFLNEYENLVYEIIKTNSLINDEEKLTKSKMIPNNKKKIEILKDFIEFQNIKNIIFSKSSFKNSYKIDEKLYSDILEEMRKEVSDWNGKLVFVYLPDWGRFYQKYSIARFFHKKKIESIVKSQGIAYLDMVKEFEKEENPIQLFPFGVYGHYTTEGYKLITKNLIKYF